MSPTYVKAEQKRLRDLGLDEKWLQDKIVDDPTILGLGDVTIIDRERSQPTGGRLDFLLWEPDEEIRYEVEIMLGRLDESHIIRTIEYWDIERTRFPQLEHRAVIIAEDITNRFFNIISILNRAVPIIAIQLAALQINDQFALNFTKILDVAELFGEDEAAPSERADRAFWEKNANPASMRVVDKVIALVPKADGPPRVTYNKGHVALGTSGRNFLWFHPRKKAPHCHMNLLLKGDERTEWITRLEEAGIRARPRVNEMSVSLSEEEIARDERLIRELLYKCDELSRS